MLNLNLFVILVVANKASNQFTPYIATGTGGLKDFCNRFITLLFFNRVCSKFILTLTPAGFILLYLSISTFWMPHLSPLRNILFPISGQMFCLGILQGSSNDFLFFSDNFFRQLISLLSSLFFSQPIDMVVDRDLGEPIISNQFVKRRDIVQNNL